MNSRPRAYESPALPLSYPGTIQIVDHTAPNPFGAGTECAVRLTRLRKISIVFSNRHNVLMSNEKQTREVERMALPREEAAADPVPAWESIWRVGVTMLGKIMFYVRGVKS